MWNFNLKQYQIEGVNSSLVHDYFIIGDDMGLGKSAQALAFSLLRSKKTLIVCPKYLIANWQNEIEKFCKEPKKVHVIKKDKYDYLGSDFVIVPYSLLHYPVCEDLFYWSDLVIADEAHYLKNMGAEESPIKRTEIFHRLTFESQVKNLLLLTGTPIENSVLDLHSLLTLVSYNPNNAYVNKFCEDYPTAIDFAEEFANKTLIRVGRRRHVRYEGVKNLEKLQQVIKGKYIRRLAKDELTLPDKQIIDVVASFEDNPALEQEWNNFVRTQRSTKVEVKVEAAVKTASFTKEFAYDVVSQGRRAIIYSDHREPTRLVYDHLISKGLRVAYIDGSVGSEFRYPLACKLQNGELDAICATISSFNTGYNITNVQVEIFNDSSWLPGRNEQAIGRIYRIGQKEKVTIYRVIGSKQAKKIYATNEAKNEVIYNVFNKR